MTLISHCFPTQHQVFGLSDGINVICEVRTELISHLYIYIYASYIYIKYRVSLVFKALGSPSPLFTHQRQYKIYTDINNYIVITAFAYFLTVIRLTRQTMYV